MPYTKNGVPYSNPSTSLDAAVSNEKSVGSMREKVYRFVTARDGATCDEVEVGLVMRHQTASARLRDLVMKNRIFDSERRRTTRSGRNAIVWRARSDPQQLALPLSPELSK